MTAAGKRVTVGRMPGWMRSRERGSLFWLRVMSLISLAFGRRVSRLALGFGAAYFVLAAGDARRASRAWLQRALRRPVGLRDVYRHMRAFACTIHDRVYLLNDRHALFDVRVMGGEALRGRNLGGQGCFLFGAHLGSFEVLRALARNQPQLKVSIAMYPGNAQRIQSVLAAINPQLVQDIIAIGQLDSMLTVRDRICDGALVGILADRASGPDQYLTLPFFGEPAEFPTGPFRMAVMLGHPVYFMAGLYRGGNRYDVHFELLDGAVGAVTREAAVEALMRRYVEVLERHSLDAPYNWFNFFDFWERH